MCDFRILLRLQLSQVYFNSYVDSLYISNPRFLDSLKFASLNASEFVHVPTSMYRALLPIVLKLRLLLGNRPDDGIDRLDIWP